MPRPSVPAFVVFGSTVNPASEIGQFGSYASPVYSNLLSTIMSGTAWPRGWFAETINTNRPFIQDFNAVDYVFSAYINYIMTLGVVEYIAAMTYWTNSIVQVAGQFFISLVDNNTGNAPASSPSQWQSGIPGMEVSGVIKPYAGSVAPSGYLICNGQAVSRTTYATLYAICGTQYGIGDGSTTFNVPDLRGKVPVAYLAADPNFGTIGGTGGEASHTLSNNELPAHNHGIQASDGTGSGPAGYLVNNGNHAVSTIYTLNDGGGAAHNNVQPYQTIGCFIIKT